MGKAGRHHAKKRQSDELAQQSSKLMTGIKVRAIGSFLLAVAISVAYQTGLVHADDPAASLISEAAKTPDVAASSAMLALDQREGEVEDATVNPTLANLNFVCENQASICHDSIEVVDRKLMAKGPIEPGSILFRIPRQAQLRDIDAFRDPDVQSFFAARHVDIDPVTKQAKGLENGAYMAIHLALHRNDADKRSSDPLLDQLYRNMPSDWSFHPVFWSEDVLKQRLPRHSQAYIEIRKKQMLINKEYRALYKANPRMLQSRGVTATTYRAMRLAVLTRAYSHTSRDALQEAYGRAMNNPQTQKQGIALILIADMFDSHPNSNVEYRRDETGAIIFLARSIDSDGSEMVELVSSYAVDNNSHLFARYGFAHDDGSIGSAASLMLYQTPNVPDGHDVANPNGMTPTQIHQQLKYAMVHYLRFDDGYDQCVTQATHTNTDIELKKTKFQALLSLARQDAYWTLTLPANTTPQTCDAPDCRTETVLQIPPQVQLTCRVMSLSASDYDGNALTVLRNGNEFRKQQGAPVSDELHFKELRCLNRLISIAVEGYKASTHSEENGNNVDRMVHVLRSSELHTLKAYQAKVRSDLQQPRFKSIRAKTTIRQKPCPLQDSKFLLSI